ncbi:unnamed protein product [Ixodes hexagonus]
MVFYASVALLTRECSKNAPRFCCFHLGVNLGKECQGQSVQESPGRRSRVDPPFPTPVGEQIFVSTRYHRPILASYVSAEVGACAASDDSVHREYIPGTVFGFFREIVASVRFLQTRFSMEYLSNVPRKKLCKDIRESVFKAPIYRTVYFEGPGQDVLKREADASQARDQDFLF